jgi:hypothetical protein
MVRLNKKGDEKKMNYLQYLQTGKIIRIGDKIKIIKYKKESLIGKEGIVKQIASTGKIRVTVEKWNYWVNFNEIELLKSSYIFDQEPLYQDISIIPSPKFIREPKYKIGQELKIIDGGGEFLCPQYILIEHDIKNEIKNIYYKSFEGKIIKEEELTDDIANRRKYIIKNNIVEAYQNIFPHYIDTLEGERWAEKGDYIIRDIEGKEYCLAEEIFKKKCDKIEEKHDIENEIKKIKEEKEWDKVKEPEQILKNKYEEKHKDKNKIFDNSKEIKTNNIVDIISVINEYIYNGNKKEMFNYKFNIGNKVMLIKTMNKVKGTITSRKFWNSKLQYGVLVDNIVRTIVEDDLELYIEEEKKEDNEYNFKYKIGDMILSLTDGEVSVKDRRLFTLVDGSKINQYKLQDISDKWRIKDEWINEDELNISDKINKMARQDEMFKWMLKSTVFYVDYGITLKVQIADRRITKERNLGMRIDICEYRIVNEHIDKWVKERELIDNIVLPEIKKTIICPDCNGEGVIGRENAIGIGNYTCPKCNGTGKIDM